MPHKIIIFSFRLLYFHVSYSALFSTQHFSTLILHTRSRDTLLNEVVWVIKWRRIAELISGGSPVLRCRLDPDIKIAFSEHSLDGVWSKRVEELVVREIASVWRLWDLSPH